MNNLSLQPDDHMKWIYDIYHRDYHSDYAEDLRERRLLAISNAPEWMVELSALNDHIRQAE